MGKKKVTLSIDEKVYDSFQKYCKENAIMLSKKIEIFMKEIASKKNAQLSLITPFIVLFALTLLTVSFVSADVIFTDNFESGTLNGWNLTSVSGANNWTAESTDPQEGSFHAQSQPQDTTEPASVIDRGINTSGFENITLVYYRKLIGLDIADTFEAEWFDGSSWIIVETTSSADDTDYVMQSFDLGSNADNNTDFRIKYECTAGAVSEYCRLDNITLLGDSTDPGDITSPSVTIVLPQNVSYNSVQTQMEYAASDDVALDSCWYSLDGGKTNNSIVCGKNLSSLDSGQDSSTWAVYANDSSGNEGSDSVTFFVDSIAPEIDFVLPTEINSSVLGVGQILVNVSANDSNLENITIRLFNGSHVLLSENVSLTSPFFINYSGLEEGDYFFNASAFDSLNSNSTETRQVTIAFDNQGPVFVNFTENPGNGTSFSPDRSYVFNSTITDQSDLDIVFIEFDGINYTPTNIGDEYSFNISGLAAGTYSYYWWANDTSGNVNTTEVRSYSVVKAVPDLTLMLNDTENNITFNFGGQVNASASSSTSPVQLLRDGEDVTSENNIFVTLGSGFYNYTSRALENENYTEASAVLFANVTKAQSSCTITSNSPVEYPDPVNVSGSCDNPEASEALYRDGNDVSSENGQEVVLGAGNYEYVINVTQSQNYTTAEAGTTATVNQGSPVLSIEIMPSSSVVFGTETNATGVGCPAELSCQFFRDDGLVSNPDIATLAAGTYGYVYNTTGNQNYTEAGVNQSLAVNISASEVQTFLNHSRENVTITQGDSIYLNGTLVTGGGEISLYNGGALINQGISTLANLTEFNTLGAFNITTLYHGNENYTSSSETWYVQVLDGSPPGSVSDLANISVSHQSITWNWTNPIDADFNGTVVYLDGENIVNLSSGVNELNATGLESNTSYTLKVHTVDESGNVNETDVSSTASTLPAPPDVTPPVLSIVSPMNISYSLVQTALNYTVFDAALDSCWYSLDQGSTNISVTCGENITALDSGQGSQTWQVYANDSSGNEGSDEVMFFVDSISPSVELTEPAEGENFGSNESISLSFSVGDPGSGVDSCWYSIDAGQSNVSLPSCQGTSFNVSGDGSYTARVWSNDSLGNEGSDARAFSVLMGSPSLVLESPVGSYLDNGSVTFTYVPDHAALDTCTLWGDFGSGFQSNASDAAPVSGSQNTFSLALVDGAYTWNVFCNTTAGIGAFDGNQTFYVDTKTPGLVLAEPSDIEYSLTSIPLEYTVNDTSPVSCYYNVSFANGTKVSNASIPDCGSTVFSVPEENEYLLNLRVTDAAGNSNATNKSFDVEVPDDPVVTIARPTACSVFGNNQSLALNFSVQNNTALDSCWYSLDGGLSTELVDDCQSASFNVSGNGEFEVIVYANESIFGKTGEARTHFSVALDAPSIVPLAPGNGTYTNQAPLSFFYDSEANQGSLDSCQLLSDFGGNYSVNQTDLSVLEGQNNFSVNVTEGQYLWALACNNTAGFSSAMMCNYTVTSDVTPPETSITEPSGTYSPSSDIPIDVSVTDNLSPLAGCTYQVNVTGSSQSELLSFTSLDCSDTFISITIPDSYLFSLFAEDEAGNMAESQSFFTIEESSGDDGGSDDGGGSDGGGDGGPPPVSGEPDLNFTALSALEMRRDQGDFIVLEVFNTGERFLNDCKLIPNGAVASWIENQQVESISSGQKVDYIFGLNVPRDADSGTYSSDLNIECEEYTEGTPLTVIVLPSDFSLVIQNIERAGIDLIVDYSIEDFRGTEQEIVLSYSLINPDGVTTFNGQDTLNLASGEVQNNVIEFELPKDSVGEFTFVLEAENERETLTVDQTVVLSEGGVTGFVVSDANLRTLTILWIVILAFIAIYFVISLLKRRAKNAKTGHARNKQYIRINAKDETAPAIGDWE